MRGMPAVLLCCFVAIGCDGFSRPTQTKSPDASMPSSVQEAASPEVAIPAEPAPKELQQSVAATEEAIVPAPEEADTLSRAEVEKMISGSLMDEAVKKTVAEATGEALKTGIPVVFSPETVIAENRWGFAVYDPVTGITEFFYNDGVKIGSKEESRESAQEIAGPQTGV
jgi:hypothetical protein